MKVLVTGGTGVVGGSAVDHLLKRGHRVRLLARNAGRDARRWESGVEARDGSVADAEGVRGSAEGCDAVLHVAGIVAEDPPEVTFERVNVQGTRNLVREAIRAGVGRFVYVSSLGAERGESDYHRSKFAAEEVVRAEFPGDWVVLRPGNVYGPGDEVISQILKMVRTLPVVPVVGRGEHRFQPMWVEDLGAALARSVEPETPARSALLLAGPETVTAAGLLDHLEAITDKHPTHLPIPEWVAQAGAGAAERLGIELPFTEDQITMLREENVIRPGETNALVEVYGIQPTPLAQGLRKLADALPEQLPSEGTGTLHRQRYWADIRRSRLDADALFELVRTRFPEITPELLEVGAEPGSPTALEERATVTLEIPLRGHVQVRVEEVRDRVISCVTLEGHPLSGVIRFMVEDRPEGFLRFEIRSYTRPSDLVDWVGLKAGGEAAQKVTWTTTVEEVVRRSGGTAPEGVQTRNESLRGEDAAEVERWVEELVLRRKRAEDAGSVPAAADQRG